MLKGRLPRELNSLTVFERWPEIVIGHRGSNSVILLPLNCNCSQVPQIFAGSFVRYSLSMRTKETVKSWGACEQLLEIISLQQGMNGSLWCKSAGIETESVYRKLRAFQKTVGRKKLLQPLNRAVFQPGQGDVG